MSTRATNLQKELSETYEQASRAWLNRVNSEIALWSELATKLSTTRSIPEALEVYQKCAAQRCKWLSRTDSDYLMNVETLLKRLLKRCPTDGRQERCETRQIKC